jgi:hypothetical protein
MNTQIIRTLVAKVEKENTKKLISNLQTTYKNRKT